ncbi:Crp/Fnr family transcriptional regulator [Selenomonas sp. FOBRC6]|uniref:Crp/Fnr family transcriptional regulator n=1 Tax=Selenomonas sp. FOBRC6 TaxID=936572 RepID=UPI000277F520|nr:Crp/Fnr family transcriptional regulator [Selenomonas sp. FOBRC6]EJO22497.1 cyclic nucleotide-binding domain protein [Selenomonas sp. FOBRC6]
MLTHAILTPHTELLLQHDLFEGIPAEALPELLNALGGELKRYAAGTDIMRMGRAPIVTGIILTGAVEVSFLNENADQIDMSIFEAGKSFGETMEGANLSASRMFVKALRDTVILRISFRQLYARTECSDPHLWRFTLNMLRRISQKGIFYQHKIRIMGQKSIRAKLSVYLQAIAGEDGAGLREMNQTQLARYLGVERSALSREMSHMRDEGLIDYDRKTLRVLQPDFLAL